MFATTSSAALANLASQPQLMSNLQANITLFRQQFTKIEPSPYPLNINGTIPENGAASSPGPTPPANKDALIHIPSHPASGLIHIFLLHPPEGVEPEELIVQEIVDEVLANGVLITRARRLRGQETFEPEPSLKVYISGAMTRKEVEKAGQTIRHAIQKVCTSKPEPSGGGGQLTTQRNGDPPSLLPSAWQQDYASTVL